MSRFFIKTKESTSVISGTKMFLDGEYLYVYNGDELFGMFLASAIIDAHRTERAD